MSTERHSPADPRAATLARRAERYAALRAVGGLGIIFTVYNMYNIIIYSETSSIHFNIT